MRLIDVDAIPWQECLNTNGYAEPLDKVIAVIQNMPTIEAEPIVRCKDCKYFEEIMTARFRDGTTKEVQICKNRVPLKGENFYCGYGEQRRAKDGVE